MSLVRYGGRGRRRALHLGLPELEELRDRALWLGRPAPGGNGDDGYLRARWPEVPRAQRRPELHVPPGDLIPDPVPRPGRGRPLLGEARRGRRARPVWLAQGPLRPLLAG